MNTHSTRKLVLSLMTVALVAAAGYGIRSLNSGIVGQSIGAGEASVGVYRATTDSTWARNGFTEEAAWGSVRFPQIVTDSDPSLATVRLDGGQVRKQRTDNQAGTADTIDIFTLAGDPSALGGGLVGETGSLEEVAIPGHDTRVSIGFSRSYANPVVFVQVAHHFGSDPVMAYVDDVQSDSATVVLTEPASWDGYHLPERVHYLVLEAGTYLLDDGAVLEVGTVSANRQARGYNRTPAVTLQTPTLGEPVVVTAIQSSSLPGFMETRVRKTTDGSDRYTGFETRFAHEQDGATAGPAVNYTVGYLSYGTPFVEGPGTLVLRDARGDWAGYDYTRRPRGACIDLAGTAADGLSTGYYTAAPANSAVSVVLYGEPNCTGSTQMGDFTTSDAVESVAPTAPIDARSVRVMWQSTVTETERRAWAEGEVIIQDEFSSFMVENGDLKLFRTLPAEGMVYEAWSTGYGDIAEARFNADGSFALHTANGTQRFTTNAGARVERLEIMSGCVLVTVKDTDAIKDAVGGECLADEVPSTALPAMPDLAVIFTDLDRDGHNELVLDVQLPDGSGHLFDNPLSIADLLTTHGFDVPADWWELLSPTQQALLLAQIPEEMGYGETVDGAETQATIAAFDASGESRPAASISYSSRVKSNGVEGGGAVTATTDTYVLLPGGVVARVPATQTTITAGEVQYVAEVDEYGPGYTVTVTTLQIDYTVAGTATVSFVGPSAGASNNLDAGGYTLGVGASAVGVGFAVGDEEGSYAGINADVGVGFWADAAFGRNGQYGLAIQVPAVPVGVAVYVHEDDAYAAYAFAEGWAIEGYETVHELGPAYWAYTRQWVMNDPTRSARVAVENTWDDSRVTVLSYADAGVAKVKMMVGSTSTAITTVLDGVDELDDALAVVDGALADGAAAVGQALTDWANGVGQDYVDAGTDLLAGAKAIYKKVKFW